MNGGGGASAFAPPLPYIRARIRRAVRGEQRLLDSRFRGNDGGKSGMAATGRGLSRRPFLYIRKTYRRRAGCGNERCRRGVRRRASPSLYKEARSRRAESGGFALFGNPLPYQDHVDFAGAVDAGYYFVLDVGGSAGAGYQVHVAAERVGGEGGAAEGEELV